MEIPANTSMPQSFPELRRLPHFTVPLSACPRRVGRRFAATMIAIATLTFTLEILTAQIIGTSSVDITEYSGVSVAQGITAGPDGAVWFTQRTAGKIGRISMSGSITEFALPNTGVQPYVITAGPDGALWFTEVIGNKIGRITTNGAIAEFPLPTASASPQGITIEGAAGRRAADRGRQLSGCRHELPSSRPASGSAIPSRAETFF